MVEPTLWTLNHLTRIEGGRKLCKGWTLRLPKNHNETIIPKLVTIIPKLVTIIPKVVTIIPKLVSWVDNCHCQNKTYSISLLGKGVVQGMNFQRTARPEQHLLLFDPATRTSQWKSLRRWSKVMVWSLLGSLLNLSPRNKDTNMDWLMKTSILYYGFMNINPLLMELVK